MKIRTFASKLLVLMNVWKHLKFIMKLYVSAVSLPIQLSLRKQIICARALKTNRFSSFPSSSTCLVDKDDSDFGVPYLQSIFLLLDRYSAFLSWYFVWKNLYNLHTILHHNVFLWPHHCTQDMSVPSRMALALYSLLFRNYLWTTQQV